METLAREVYDDLSDTEYDTGILDSNGAPIIHVVSRNPIGFRAEIEE